MTTPTTRAEIRIGGSRAWPDLIAPGNAGQWSFVAENCDGFYINNFAMRLAKETPKTKRAANLVAVRDLLKNKSVFYETDLIHSTDGFDRDAIAAFGEAGLTWVGSTINYGNSPERTSIITDSGKLPLYYMFGPWHGGGDIAKPENEKVRANILAQAGGSVDGPVTMWSKNAGSMKSMVYSTIRWCHANHKKFLYLLAPNESGKNFLKESQQLVHDMEDNGVSPDIWAVSFYGPQQFRDLLETLPEKTADGKPAETFSGVAYWLIHHLRDPQHFARIDDVAKPPADAANSTAIASYHIHNDSTWLDLCPVVHLSIDDPEHRFALTVRLDGQDVTDIVALSGNLAFMGARRLQPGASHTLTLSLTDKRPIAAAKLPTVSLTMLPNPSQTTVEQTVAVAFRRLKPAATRHKVSIAAREARGRRLTNATQVVE